ncbi:MAG: nucleotidyltransferase family protein, partial [Acinetobacter sp.]|nr:nucleotidyltransferase family protein [Acinetobacter sp.]
APIQPLRSISHAVSLWPETATVVAVRLDAQGNLQILAPLGLADLFQLRLRWNPALVSCTVFLDRARSKGFLAKWPKLKLAPAFFYRRRQKSLPFRKAFAD